MATTQVLANSLLSIGLENLVCGKKAFVNFDRTLLMSGVHSMVPRQNLVLEILESVQPDDEFVADCEPFPEPPGDEADVQEVEEAWNEAISG